jgi:hypothetical protein
MRPSGPLRHAFCSFQPLSIDGRKIMQKYTEVSTFFLLQNVREAGLTSGTGFRPQIGSTDPPGKLPSKKLQDRERAGRTSSAAGMA